MRTTGYELKSELDILMKSPDRALNMTQLSKVTGYKREHLGKVLKPFLIGGKIRLREFDRIMDKRQDEIETALRSFTPPPRDALTPEDHDRIQRRADVMFYAPSRSKDRRK